MSNGQQRSKWSQYEKWLKPVHLKQGKGALTIAAVADEELYDGHGKSDLIPVASFKECRYKLTLTLTNRRKLTELFGDEIEGCIAKRVVIEVASVKVGPQTKSVLRITAVAPAAKLDVKTGELVDSAGK
jgi:hypothetical protein